jgi:hypothetical protein
LIQRKKAHFQQKHRKAYLITYIHLLKVIIQRETGPDQIPSSSDLDRGTQHQGFGATGNNE